MKPLRVFIIQPFGEDHSKIFRSLIEEVCESKKLKGEFIAFHATDEPSSHPRLQDRVNEYIKRTDICVADLTGKRNENALLEVGASYALGVPVIIFSDKELPSDIRGQLYIKFDLSGLSKKSRQDEFKENLKNRLLEARQRIASTRNSVQFLSHAFIDRGSVDFGSLIRRAENRISILTTNLSYLVTEEIDNRNGEALTFLDILYEELTRKKARFELNILSLDPDSNYTNERALSLGRDRRTFREEMREDLRIVKNFVEKECPVIGEIRIYDSYPLQMTFFFDDMVVASVVAEARSSRLCMTYMHSLKEMGAKESYEMHFRHLWGGGCSYAISHSHQTKVGRQIPRKLSTVFKAY